MSEQIVIVGFGPVAARLVEELLPTVTAGRVALTVLGAERAPAYNRVLLGEVAVGRVDPTTLTSLDVDGLRAAGARVELGTEVVAIDRSHRCVQTADGGHHRYDRLVLATGARAFVPPLAGLENGLPPGATTLRDLEDAADVRGALAAGDSVVILGGGVLGVEAALAAREEGAPVTLVHTGAWPLHGVLDHGGGRLLAAEMRAAGIDLVAGSATVVRVGTDGRFAGLELADGEVVRGGLLLVSCGVRARTRLAEAAGLAVGRGIRVDHQLRAEDRVYAVGDCAEVRCPAPTCPSCGEGTGPAGLVGPGWRQAEWLAAHLLGSGTGPLTPERPAPLLLKARGLDVVVAGAVDDEPFDALDGARQVTQWADPAHRSYAKIVTDDGVLAGVVCIGLPRTAAELVLLLERGAELPADRASLLNLEVADTPPRVGARPEDTLCRCSGATVGAVESAIHDGCATVADVGAATRAGTGCGSCTERICALLDLRQAALVG
ncbi:FAD-dependent oxidoreductase [Georgenia sp. H159]|uniref:FAD-dependent oxidoreductase n=1 Tax=Georgenia sp. H159 TaxID=3076115 RepID=UPI002D784203|nr:FAD-dependent oxidoreductase [Georgenia sp. H159]